MSKFKECSKIVRQQEFARAIAVETVKKRVAESIDIESMSEQEEEGGRGEGGREGGREGEREGGRSGRCKEGEVYVCNIREGGWRRVGGEGIVFVCCY